MGWKQKVAQMSGTNIELNRKSLQIKKSWDEVAKILQPKDKKRKK